jgi:AAA domain
MKEDEGRRQPAPDDATQAQDTEPKPANLQSPKQVAPLHLSDDREYSLDQLLAMQFNDQPLAFLTRNDVIFKGSSTLLAAREKVGKSTLLRHLSYQWAVEGVKVLYITEEWRRSWRKQADELAFQPGVGYFRIVEGMGRSAEELLDRARRGPEDIIVLDTLTWLLGISLGNRDQVIEGIRPWLMLPRLDKTLILLSHLTKKGDEIGGSYALGAGVDTLIWYREVVEDLRSVDVRSRFLGNPIKFAVRKVKANFSVEDVPGELTLTTAQAEVLAVLPVDPTEAKTVEEVVSATGYKEGKVRVTLHYLVDLGLARDIANQAGTAGGRGHAARYVAVEEEDK